MRLYARRFRPQPNCLQFSFTTRRKARRTDITVVPLADFALIRRFAQTACSFPSTTRGKASFGCADTFETAFELRWGGMKDSPVCPPSSVACGATFPLKGEGCYGGMVALRGSTRRFRPHPSLARHLPHPGEGSSRRFVTVRYSADFSVRLRSSADFSVKSRSRTEKIGTAERSLPRVGKVARQCRMRAKQASAPTSRIPPTPTVKRPSRAPIPHRVISEQMTSS